MGNRAEDQAFNVVPPRRGAVLALSVDTTARAYDLTGLSFGAAYNANDAVDSIYLTLQAQSGDVFFYFGTATSSDMDNTAVIAAGGTLAFANTYCAWLPQNASVDLRIVKTQDKFLVVKTSTGTATLRFYASSQPMR